MPPPPTTTSTIPRVQLSQPVVSAIMAARLASSVLAHVLFLKNQVPFPVMQLSRIPSEKVHKRSVKLRTELLTTFDTLSSHLVSTYAALGTALARSSEHSPERKGTAFLAFIVGPSVTAARARVIFAVDGLEVKLWGAREDWVRTLIERQRSEESGVCKDIEMEEEQDEGVEGVEEDHDMQDPQFSSSSDDSDSSEYDNDDERSERDNGLGDVDDEGGPPSSPSPSLLPSPSPCHLEPTYLETEKALYAADRLLSRVLANASSMADEGETQHGISCEEFTPTQTHVMLLAPRRFKHPSWTPRQNLTRPLGTMLDSFLAASDQQETAHSGSGNNGRKKGKANLEGVWVGADHGDVGTASAGVSPTGQVASGDEEDEMIWWAWEDKLVGFGFF